MVVLDPNRTACIVGIDPGSETLGLCLLYFDVITLELLAVEAFTFTGSKLPFMSPAIASIHGERAARLQAHRENLLNILRLKRPLAVICESPFFNPLRPSAFAPLVETLDAIRAALFEYNPYMALHLVDPPTAKNAVGAKGNAGKEDVYKAIQRLQGIPFVGCSPQTLSEHALDAFAIAYSRYKSYKSYPT